MKRKAYLSNERTKKCVFPEERQSTATESNDDVAAFTTLAAGCKNHTCSALPAAGSLQKA